MNKPDDLTYRFGRFRLDVGRERLWHNSERVELTPTEFAALLYLIKRRDRTVSIGELLDRVWQGKHVEDGSVYFVVASLRAKLRGSLREHRYKYIKTEPRKGYCFAAPVVEVREDPRQPAPPAPPEPPEPNPPNPEPPEPAPPEPVLVEPLPPEPLSVEPLPPEPGPAEPQPTEPTKPESAAELSAQAPAAEPKETRPLAAIGRAVPAPTAVGALAAERLRPGGGTFGGWMLRAGRNITTTLALSVGLAVSLSVWGFFDSHRALAALCWLHFVVIAGAFLRSPRPRGSEVFSDADPALEAEVMEDCGYGGRPVEWKEAKEHADEALGQHKMCWKVLLASWSLLYLMLAFKELSAFVTGADAAQQSLQPLGHALTMLATLFNNCSALALVLCYIILNEITVIRESGRTVGDVPWLEGLLVLAVLTFGELFLVGAVLQGGLSPEGSVRIIRGADWLSGVLGGVAMALYVGRLQSKFLGSAVWLPPLLYFYTALQPLYAHIAQDRQWAVWLISGALALKCLLYLYVVWLFKSGRLLYYFLRVRRVYEGVEAEWKSFYSIIKEKYEDGGTEQH
ncbi:MAG TPA: winged helix-turn-helix domain-containing protein [Pyrinomonadaceae bacterium]